MREIPPLVLTASVSPHDGRWVESTLERAGFQVRLVDDAEAAHGAISGRDGGYVLVIDSGLLEMPHDAQWRLLRARHPRLGAVVRCLIGADPGIRRAEGRTFHVHPDCGEGLLQAVRALARRDPAEALVSARRPRGAVGGAAADGA
jgi:DNA-binding response OmpR family regulator